MSTTSPATRASGRAPVTEVDWSPRHRGPGPTVLAPAAPGHHVAGVALAAVVAVVGLAAALLVAGLPSGSNPTSTSAAGPAQPPGPPGPPGPAQPPGPADLVGADEVASQLRASLSRADAGGGLAPGTEPPVEELRRSLWDGPGRCASAGQTWQHEICTFGDVDGSRTVVALGSSHMTMWMAGLADAASRRDTRVVGLFKFGCTPFELRSSRGGVEWEACSRWREWALQQVARLQPDGVVVGSHLDFDVLGASSVDLTGPRWRRAVAGGAARLAARLERLAADVVVLGDVPTRGSDPTRCLQRTSATGSGLERCESSVRAAHRATVQQVEAAVGRTGADFYDTGALVCLGDRCPVAAAGRFLYRDVSHVSRAWSRHVGPSLATRVGIS